jgi:hypothetical protein
LDEQISGMHYQYILEGHMDKVTSFVCVNPVNSPNSYYLVNFFFFAKNNDKMIDKRFLGYVYFNLGFKQRNELFKENYSKCT